MAGDDNRPISDTAQRIMTALFILPLLVIVSVSYTHLTLPTIELV